MKGVYYRITLNSDIIALASLMLELPGGAYRELGETQSLSYVHPNLIPGERYVFTVRASSSAGLSDASASAFVDVPPAPDLPPAPPGNLVAELTPNNDALLQWSAPVPSADRAPVVRFEVFLEIPGGGRTSIGTSRSLSFIYANLDWGRRYVFHVEAVSAVGSSRPSRSEFIDVPPQSEALPVAPGGFTAVLTPDNDVQFEWTEPAFDLNRAEVQGYLVYEVTPGGGAKMLNPDGDDAGLDPDPVNALTYLHDPDPVLVPGQRYTYYVRATSAAGTSPPSASDFVEVPFDPLVPLSIPHLSVRADQSGSDFKEVTVSWVHNLLPALQNLVKGFELQYCVVAADYKLDHCPADKWIKIDATFGPRVRTYREDVTCDNPGNSPAMDMDHARMYRVRALANNDSLSSRYSEPTRPICPGSAYSPPRRIDAVFAVPVEDETADPLVPIVPELQRVNICWEVPEVNGSPLLGYELQQTTGSDLPVSEDRWVIVDAHIPTGLTDALRDTPSLMDDQYEDPTCRLLSSLIANREYWFRVRAYNLAGHGHWSAPYHYRHGPEFVPELGRARASVPRSSVLTVSDARAREGTDASLAFEITLDRPASESVTVDYATADGTATAGQDYRATSGTLEVAAGETSKTIEVAVHADTEDEGEETLTLRLSNAAGARIEDGEATGTILDRDPLPQEWLARFGRTVAAQAVDAVGTRLASKPHTHARVGGVPIETSASPDSLEALSRQWSNPAWNPWDGPEDTRGISRHALMSGSSFHLASEGDGPVTAGGC